MGGRGEWTLRWTAVRCRPYTVPHGAETDVSIDLGLGGPRAERGGVRRGERETHGETPDATRRDTIDATRMSVPYEYDCRKQYEKICPHKIKMRKSQSAMRNLSRLRLGEITDS